MAGPGRRRATAAAAVAVAAGTMLATAVPAGAAGSAGPAFYSGATGGDVVQVAIHLPTALPGLPNPLAIGLISAAGNAVHDSVDHHYASTAFAGLASGSLVQGSNAPLAALGLGRSLQASLADPAPADSALAAIPANPLANGALGLLHALVHPVDESNLSSANLAHVNVAKLAELLPSSALTQLNNTFTQTVEPAVNNAVNQVLGTLNSLAGQDPTGTVSSIASTVQQIKNELPSVLTNLENTSLVSLDALDANQSIQRVADGAESQAHVKLIGVDILGGLVKVDGFTSDAEAFANGVAGDARASYNPVVARAEIGNGVLGATLGANGLNLTVPGLPNSVSQQVNAALKQLQAALNSLLANLGVSVHPAAGSSYAAPDGTYATATGSALTITVADVLSPKSAPLVQVKLGGTTASTRAKQLQVASYTPPKHLAFTGANLPLTGGIAVALLASAAVLRRRARPTA
jgi:hypothetical protein